MWVKVDDNFPEHPKVLKAGHLLGADGYGRVVAVWLEALCYANRNLTDGYISNAVAKRFRLDPHPLQVMRVLASRSVRLLIKVRSGFQFHDYDQYQFSKAEIEEKRRKERDRMRRVRANKSRTENLFAVPVPTRPDPSPLNQDQEQSASRTTQKPDDDNPRVLLKLAHSVFDDFDAGRLASDDLTEELKSRAAVAGIHYNGELIRKALESAEKQRRQGVTH